MLGMRKPDPKLCCPICGRAGRLRKGVTRSDISIYMMKCPSDHMGTSWYRTAAYAYAEWLDLIGLTEKRLKEHEND